MAEHLTAILDSQPHHPSSQEVIRRCIGTCMERPAARTGRADACRDRAQACRALPDVMP
jgi:hypothetical protein